MCRVSVILPCYNDAQYLPDSIESILSQTFADFELIIVDDASSDETEDVLSRFHDSRIKVLTNEVQKATAAAFNRGVHEGSSEYVARMDADDISLPDRLEKQIAFLDSRPDVGILGGQVIPFGGPNHQMVRVPTEPQHIRWRLFFGNCVGQPTVMYRRAVLEEVGLLNEKIRVASDYEYFLRSSSTHRLANLATPILRLRMRPESLSRSNAQLRESNAVGFASDAVEQLLSRDVGVEIAAVLRNPSTLSDHPGIALEAASVTEEITMKCLGEHDTSYLENRLILRDARYRLAQIVMFSRKREPRAGREIMRRSAILGPLSLGHAIAAAGGRRFGLTRQTKDTFF